MITAYWLKFLGRHEPNSIAGLRASPKCRSGPVNDEIAMLFKAHIAFALDDSTQPPTIVCGITNLNKFRFYGYGSVIPKLVIDSYGDIVQAIDRKIIMQGQFSFEPFQKAIMEKLYEMPKYQEPIE